MIDERTLNVLRILSPVPEVALALCYGLALSEPARFTALFLYGLGKTFLFEFLVLGGTMVVGILSETLRDENGRPSGELALILGLMFGASFLLYGIVIGIWFPFVNAVAQAGREVMDALSRRSSATGGRGGVVVVEALFLRLVPRMVLWMAVIIIFLAPAAGAIPEAALIEVGQQFVINPVHQTLLMRGGLYYYAAAGCLELAVGIWRWRASFRRQPGDSALAHHVRRWRY